MKISVVIPVYNAAEYLRCAVESALSQPETWEVLLVEDCSGDGSLQICRQLVDEFPKVRVLQHPSQRNLGAGASRNLGIRAAQCDYIAFLDADDFFLPGRFATATRLFGDSHEIEGVYETVGTYFNDDVVKEAWLSAGRPLVTGFREPVAPELLFEAQGPVGTKGYAHIDAWVVRKRAFEKTGLFDEDLRLHQDAAMGLKLSALCRMAIGDVDQPVAMRRVHATNRISAKRSSFRQYADFLLMWRVLWRWGRSHLAGSRRSLLLKRYLDSAAQPYTKIDNELARISLVPLCQLGYAWSRDTSLCREKRYRRQLTQCIDNFKAYVGWSKP